MTRDYIKLQELAELKDALKIKEINEDLLEHLQSSILYILDYTEKFNVPLPNLDRLESDLQRANQMICFLRSDGHPTPENQHPEETPKDSTEDKVIFC